ncbi:hypothetical protein TNCV_3169401 [Trichonephila clavipes]|nr:hypothetical protein TNCV_3169401 [Trichonephila clavipes]
MGNHELQIKHLTQSYMECDLTTTQAAVLFMRVSINTCINKDHFSKSVGVLFPGRGATLSNGSSNTIPNIFNRIVIQRPRESIHTANINSFMKFINNVSSVEPCITVHKNVIGADSTQKKPRIGFQDA